MEARFHPRYFLSKAKCLLLPHATSLIGSTVVHKKNLYSWKKMCMCLCTHTMGSQRVRHNWETNTSVQLGSVPQSCPTLCNLMDCSMPGLSVHHQPPEFIQTHVLWIGDAIQPSHPLSSPSPPTFNLFQHQSLFKWVSSSHQKAKVLELQLQHQTFQWIFRTDFL